MIRLYELDLLPYFQPEGYIIIRQACEIKEKARDLIDALIDYDECRLTQTLEQILSFIADAAIAFADIAAAPSYSIDYFVCITSRFREWYQKLDDLTRHFSPHRLLKETGFLFRSLYFSCRCLDELLSSSFSDWLAAHPDDFQIAVSSCDWSKTCFAPLPPDLDIDFDSSHYIV